MDSIVILIREKKSTMMKRRLKRTTDIPRQTVMRPRRKTRRRRKREPTQLLYLPQENLPLLFLPFRLLLLSQRSLVRPRRCPNRSLQHINPNLSPNNHPHLILLRLPHLLRRLLLRLPVPVQQASSPWEPTLLLIPLLDLLAPPAKHPPVQLHHTTHTQVTVTIIRRLPRLLPRANPLPQHLRPRYGPSRQLKTEKISGYSGLDCQKLSVGICYV